MPSNGQIKRMGLAPKSYEPASAMKTHLGLHKVRKARGPRAHDTILHAMERALNGSDRAQDPRPRRERRPLMVKAQAAGKGRVEYGKTWSQLRHEGKV